jgi:hypothetical protein
MNYIKQISTGKILESGTNEKSTMILNSVNAGIPKNDIEFGQTDSATISRWVEKQDWSAKTYDKKRKAEYPTIAELVVALYDTQDRAEIDKRRADVKKKYPKPS